MRVTTTSLSSGLDPATTTARNLKGVTVLTVTPLPFEHGFTDLGAASDLMIPASACSYASGAISSLNRVTASPRHRVRRDEGVSGDYSVFLRLDGLVGEPGYGNPQKTFHTVPSVKQVLHGNHGL